MKDEPTSNVAPSGYQLFAGAFRWLALDPAATRAEIEQAVAKAFKEATASEQVLAAVRGALLDPSQRLMCELSYPLDSSAEQIKAFERGLSDKAPLAALLPISSRLPPLSAANFLAQLAGRDVVSADLLLALVSAHAAIDAASIFELLKGQRSRAGFPMPSLVEIGEGLRTIQSLHAEAVIAAHSSNPGAAPALLECTRQILAGGDRYRIEALTHLLHAYRKAPTGTTPARLEDIDTICEKLRKQPSDASLMQQFQTALTNWVAINAPLILFDTHQNPNAPGNDAVKTIVTSATTMIGVLMADGEHVAARRATAICLAAFDFAPALLGPIKVAETSLHRLSLEASNQQLEKLINDSIYEPKLLAVALEQSGFGSTSVGPAASLWTTFGEAVAVSSQGESYQRPWQAMRHLARTLAATPQFIPAAAGLTADLLRFGETLPARPEILETLRQDLSALEAKRGAPEAPRAGASNYVKSGAAVILLSVILAGGFLAYRQLGSPASPFVLSSPASVSTEEPEAIPPVSKGERYKRDFVRYCHFQEERLRVIKSHVQGTEDIQAYNMLANDYNSRCSNFYYRDEDLALVMEEVKAKKNALEADAMRILATWPWHAAGSKAAPPGK